MIRPTSHLRWALLLGVFFFFAPTTPLAAQVEKKLEKAADRFNKGEMEEAITEARKLLGGKDDLTVWNTLIEMYYYRYMDAVDPSARISREIMEQMLKTNSMKASVRDKERCLQDLLYACREATYATTCPRASQLLRNFLVDVEPDTAISDDARKAWAKAEEAFGKKDFNGAIAEYRNTLQHAPGHYKAALYIGDCYYYLKQQDSAIAYFHRAIAMQPTLLEPRKYIVDALAAAHRNDEALNEAIPTFLIYPDESMFVKTSDLGNRMGRVLERHWFARGVDANRAGTDQKGGTGPWKQYRAAKAEIEPFCNADGVVDKPGAPGDAKYMEVYCWQRMLEKSEELPAELMFAKRMADAGYLDCYVFLCLFNHDLYGQYKVFASANTDRVGRFFKEQLMK